jgi:transposase
MLPDFGPVVSSAVASWMGDGQQFQRRHGAASALGLVPRQYTSGDKVLLSGISKRGDSYTRALVVHGARAVGRNTYKKHDALSS